MIIISTHRALETQHMNHNSHVLQNLFIPTTHFVLIYTLATVAVTNITDLD